LNLEYSEEAQRTIDASGTHIRILMGAACLEKNEEVFTVFSMLRDSIYFLFLQEQLKGIIITLLCRRRSTVASDVQRTSSGGLLA
jgi:hypothetical protein